MESLLQRRFINFLFVICFIILVGNFLLAYHLAKKSTASGSWVMHTYQVMNDVNNFQISLAVNEYLVNKYLLTNDKRYLQMLTENEKNSSALLASIKNLTKDNIQQQKNLEVLAPLLNTKLNLLHAVINLYDHGNKTQAIGSLSGIENVEIKSKILQSVNIIMTEEKRLLLVRNYNTQESLANTRATFTVSTIISLSLLLLGILLLNYYLIRNKKAEIKSVESEHRLSLLMDTVSDYTLLMIDPRGIITTWNENACRIMGYQSKEVLGKSAAVIFDIDNKVFQKKLQFSSKYKKFGKEKLQVRKDGSKFWCEFVITSIVENNEIVGFSLVIHDITERKKLDELKNEFISVVSHELRTPLTSLHGAITLLLEGVTKNSVEESKLLLEIANNNCNRLMLLIADILDFEKIESGKMQFQIQIHDLADIVKEAVKLNELYGNKFSIKLKMVNLITDTKVKVDADRLLQVFSNLISNAIKFATSNSTVVVNMEKLGKRIRVSVTNQGKGIPEDFKNKIFQRFSQVDGSSKRNLSGTGLGLAISKSIIERMGGSINFVSEENKETTFYIELNLATESSVI